MDRREFEALLAAEQFEQVVTVEREPGGSMDLHSHPFEAKALVIEGELNIRTAQEERLYRAGDIFHLRADVPHSEAFGPAGVKYLVGRKQPAPVQASRGEPAAT
jgi:quercetin dioxygenase-like cupin family protein